MVLIIVMYFTGFLDNKQVIAVKKGQSIEFTDKRPDMNDTDIFLCVPAAFSTSKGGIIGHYSTGKGREGKTDKNYTTIHLNNNTYFQQASLVKNHQPKFFKDRNHNFRRALCKKDSQFFIIHSKLPITLTEFSKQLIDYDNAWNLDMGSYSYGWYRDSKGKVNHLGLSTFFNKEKQTNWIVIKYK